MATRTSHLSLLVIAAAAIALGAGVRLLVLHTVEFPAPEPWEEGTPFVVDDRAVEPGTIVSMGAQPIGRVSREMTPWHSFPKRQPPTREVTVMRLDPQVKLASDTRFVLHELGAATVVRVVPGIRKDGRLRPWDPVTIERAPHDDAVNDTTRR